MAKSLDENNITWTRPEPLGWIDSNNIKHLYYPDFYLPDYNVYLDPKNSFLIKKDEEKINRTALQNKINIIVLTVDQLDWLTIKNKIAG